MIQDKAKALRISALLLGLVVSTLAIIAWGSSYRWNLWPLNSYVIFPVLGLLAFSLMWTHYIIGAIREIAGLKPETIQKYFRYTGYIVLLALCLHPGLLIYQLFVDGAGLPPSSYKSYVAPGLGWITLLGTAALLVFLAFEFHRVLGKKSWWQYVVDASDFAMLAIVYHGLKLGTDLMTQSWYRWIWWFYALTLLIVLIRKYSLRLTNRTNPAN